MKRLLSLTLLFAATAAFAGGPLVVGSAQFGVDGQAFKWDVTHPIAYTVDSGPLSPLVNNAAALTRIAAITGTWSSVPTTALQFSYAGPLKAAPGFPGGHVRSISDFNALFGDCDNGSQSPVIFDSDGSLFAALGLPPDIIGIGGQCKLDTSTGHIVTSFAFLNGIFQDGVNSYNNYELSAHQFDEAITHEFGHFLGLDHSQINIDLIQTGGNCAGDDRFTALPLMFPYEFCPARVDSGLPVLSPDDKAWISYLYPNSKFNQTYGIITGHILFRDRLSGVQGQNVIARLIDDPNTAANESLTTAFSAVSGLYFTGNPGQPYTGDNPGSQFGTRQAALQGYYEIPVLAGNYTVQNEDVYSSFTGGSSVGPLRQPIVMGVPEFWNSYETSVDDPLDFTVVTVAPGQTVSNIDVIVNLYTDRFDANETSWTTPPPLWLKPKEEEAA